MPQREPIGPGQESVWDYPRPPAIERVTDCIRIEFGGEIIVETQHAWRVLETSHPPNYYLPVRDFCAGTLRSAGGRSLCEWKGLAHYYDIVMGAGESRQAGWGYADPVKEFEMLRDHVAIYAGRVDACYVGDDRVVPQPGGFYGGWITPDVVGPFKGEAGTEWW